MIDPTLLATTAVAALSPYFLEAAKGAAGKAGEDAYAGGKKLFEWLKQKLTGDAQKALERVEADPGNSDKQAALRVGLSEALEADSGLHTELASLLQSLPQVMGSQQSNQVGDGNTTAQALGKNIHINIGGKN
jgi:hypothetical protein